jgi:hypothetical protein
LYHSCAIQAGSGAVICWGDDTAGQATPPPSVNGITGTASAIGVGSYPSVSGTLVGNTCAIQAGSGAVVCWGYQDFAQETPPPSVDGTSGTASAIAISGLHACAIQAGSGAVVCWGYNYSGMATPPPSVDGTIGTASAIALDLDNSCAIQAGTGRVICWGNDGSPPPSVDGTTGIASAIAAGSYNTCAIQAGIGSVICWGDNNSGQATPPPSVNGTIGTASSIGVGVNKILAIRGPCLPGVVADPACSPNDRDLDGISDGTDNCPFYTTINLADTDSDGRGNVCECTDQNGDGRNNVMDLVAINRAIFNPSQITPLCDGNNDGRCDVSDILAANVEIFSPGNTSTCAGQPVPGP